MQNVTSNFPILCSQKVYKKSLYGKLIEKERE